MTIQGDVILKRVSGMIQKFCEWDTFLLLCECFYMYFFFLSIYPNSYHLTSEYIFHAGHLGLFVLGLLKSFHGSHSNEMHTLSKNLHSKNKYLITY